MVLHYVDGMFEAERDSISWKEDHVNVDLSVASKLDSTGGSSRPKNWVNVTVSSKWEHEFKFGID